MRENIKGIGPGKNIKGFVEVQGKHGLQLLIGVNLLKHLFKMIHLVQRFVGEKMNLGQYAHMQIFGYFPANPAGGVAQSDEGTFALGLAAEEADIHIGVTQIVGHAHFHDRYKADARVFDALHQQLCNFFFDKRGDAHGSGFCLHSISIL